MNGPILPDAELDRLLATVAAPAPSADLADRIAARAATTPQARATMFAAWRRPRLRRPVVAAGIMLNLAALGAAAAAAASWDGHRFDLRRLAEVPHRALVALHLHHHAPHRAAPVHRVAAVHAAPAPAAHRPPPPRPAVPTAIAVVAPLAAPSEAVRERRWAFRVQHRPAARLHALRLQAALHRQGRRPAPAPAGPILPPPAPSVPPREAGAAAASWPAAPGRATARAERQAERRALRQAWREAHGLRRGRGQGAGGDSVRARGDGATDRALPDRAVARHGWERHGWARHGWRRGGLRFRP